MVPAGEELGKATDIEEGGFNSGGTVQIDWTAAPNADGYVIYAVNVAEASDDDGEVVTRASITLTPTTWNIDGLTVGQDYDIYVVATASGQDPVWPDAGSSDSPGNRTGSRKLIPLGHALFWRQLPTEQSQGN